MSWEGRVGFVLTESMQLKKLAFLEGVFDDRADDGESGFDTDVALTTGELSKLIPELIEALSGEMAFGAAAPDAPAAAPAKPKQEAVTAVGEDDDPPF
ncbi:Recombination-associated protein RdgC [compost metagenome]